MEVLNRIAETLKLFEENIRINPYKLLFPSGFLDKTPEVQMKKKEGPHVFKK